jgi:hypothetical protein
MERESLDDEAVARLVRTRNLNCDRTQINKYRRGLIRPDWPIIRRLKIVSGGDVTADDFLELEAAG